MNVEWAPDGTYPTRWAVYDALTAMVVATPIALLWGLV
jgi:hypothetical protein